LLPGDLAANGPSEAGLKLLAERYLPGLRILTPREAEKLSSTGLPASVAEMLTGFSVSSKQQISDRLKGFDSAPVQTDMSELGY